MKTLFLQSGIKENKKAPNVWQFLLKGRGKYDQIPRLGGNYEWGKYRFNLLISIDFLEQCHPFELPVTMEM